VGAVVAALLLGLACGALGVAHARHVRALRPSRLDGLRATLRRLPLEQRAGALLDQVGAGGWLDELASALAAPIDSRARAAAVNDVLGDLASELERGSSWPRAAVRLTAFGGLLLVAVSVLRSEGALIVAIVIGLVATGGLVAAFAGQRARVMARALREDVDAIVALCVSVADRAEASERPGRRRR
jgi:hypothetical protein